MGTKVKHSPHGRVATVLRCSSAALASTALLAALGVAASSPALANSKASTKTVNLTWWTWTANPKTVVNNFEKSHPGIKVTYKDVGSGGGEYTKLLTVLKAGSGAPDVVQIEYDILPEFIATKKLVNIAPYVDRYKKDYPSWVWDQVSVGSAVYAVPEDIGPLAMIYEPSIFKKYHLVVPKTWAQYEKDAVKLHKADPSEYMTLNPAAPDNGGEIIAMFWQAGAQLFKEQSNGTWDIAINTPATRRVLSYWAALGKDGATSLATAYTVSDYHNIALGKYATYLQAAWYPSYEIVPYLTKKVPQHFAVTQLPQWTAGAHASANNGGSTNAVTDQAPDPKAAAEFAAYINTSSSGINIDETTASSGGRGLFAAASARASAPAFKSTRIPNFPANTMTVYSQAAQGVNTGFVWSPWTQDLENALSVEADAAASGKMSVPSALSKVQSTIVTDAESGGYSVKVSSKNLGL